MCRPISKSTFILALVLDSHNQKQTQTKNNTGGKQSNRKAQAISVYCCRVTRWKSPVRSKCEAEVSREFHAVFSPGLATAPYILLWRNADGMVGNRKKRRGTAYPAGSSTLNFNAFVYREKNSILVFFQTKNNSAFISRPPCLYAIPQAP